MADNFFFWINNAIQLMLTNAGDPLQAIGMGWFQAFAAGLIVFRGWQIAFGAAGPKTVASIMFLLVKILICLSLLKWYNLPIPGFDNTFHGYITGTGAHLAAQIDMAMTEKVTSKFSEVILGMESPAWYDVFSSIAAHIHYYGVVLVITLMQSAIVCVIAFGWVACGVIVLLGPCFIPFWLIPGKEHLFWGWLNALVQYSFYPVVANAFVFIYGHVFMEFFTFYPPPYDSSKIAAMALVTVSLACALVFGFYKLPGLVADLFAGRSGQHTTPAIGWLRG